MTFHGHIQDGRIVLDEPCALPEGTPVLVQPLAPQEPTEGESLPTLYERLQPFIGSVEGLPRDASVNHDHYLYGTPKKA